MRSLMGVGVMKLLSIPIGLLTSIVLARVLGPEGFGKYVFVIALIPLITLPVSGGLPHLLTREVAGYYQTKNWSLYKGILRTAHVWVLLISILVVAVYWVGGSIFGIWPSTGKWGLLAIAIFLVPLQGFAAIRNGTIKGLGRPALSELPTKLIQPILFLSFVSIMAVFSILDPETAIWAQLIAYILVFGIATLIFLYLQPKEILSVRPEYQMSSWGRALLPISLLILVGTFNSQIAIIVLGMLNTDDMVAGMRIAERGGQFVVMSLTLVNMVIAPHIVNASKSGDINRLQKLAKKTAKGSFFVALPVVIIFILFGETLIKLTFGGEYIDTSFIPLVIICLGQLTNVFFGSAGYLLIMSGFERDALISQIIAIIINITLSLLLSPIYGAVGAAISISVSIIIWNCLLAWKVWKRMGIKSLAI